MESLILSVILSLPLFMAGLLLISWGREAQRKAKRDKEWAEEMRAKFPWLRG